MSWLTVMGVESLMTHNCSLFYRPFLPSTASLLLYHLSPFYHSRSAVNLDFAQIAYDLPHPVPCITKWHETARVPLLYASCVEEPLLANNPYLPTVLMPGRIGRSGIIQGVMAGKGRGSFVLTDDTV